MFDLAGKVALVTGAGQHTGEGIAMLLGRLGTPDDVAAAVLWLASPEGAWVTGQTIGINGGSTTS